MYYLSITSFHKNSNGMWLRSNPFHEGGADIFKSSGMNQKLTDSSRNIVS